MGSSPSKPSAVETVATDVKKNVSKAADKSSEAATKAKKDIKKAANQVSKAIDDATTPKKQQEHRIHTKDVAAAVPIVALLVGVGYFAWKRYKQEKEDKQDSGAEKSA